MKNNYVTSQGVKLSIGDIIAFPFTEGVEYPKFKVTEFTEFGVMVVPLFGDWVIHQNVSKRTIRRLAITIFK